MKNDLIKPGLLVAAHTIDPSLITDSSALLARLGPQYCGSGMQQLMGVGLLKSVLK